MSDKRLRLDLLPDGFLIQVLGYDEYLQEDCWTEDYKLMGKSFRSDDSVYKAYRPALNYWHFYYGGDDFILPDGFMGAFYCHDIVDFCGIECIGFDLDYPDESRPVSLDFGRFNLKYIEGKTTSSFRHLSTPFAYCIVGVDAEHAKHGAELGMEVVEV